jgi:predicted CXXCH cytochrome family protein
VNKGTNSLKKEWKIVKKVLLTLSLVLFLCLAISGAASAHIQGDKTVASGSCTVCHPANTDKQAYGPHGGYSATTQKCQTCHGLHDADSPNLLPGATVTAVCNYCHDLTGTNYAPYYAADLAAPGTEIKAAHRTFNTVNGQVYFSDDGVGSYGGVLSGADQQIIGGTTIPGGSSTDGGNSTLDTSAQGATSGNTFTCNSCHTPHGLRTVDNYLGESNVKMVAEKRQTAGGADRTHEELYLTNRLLRSNVNGQTVTQYGTAWCAACHAGRNNMHTVNGVYNHPVDQNGPGYDFETDGRNQLATLGTKGLTPNTTTYGTVYYKISANDSADVNFLYDPRSNKWFTGIAIDSLNGDAPRPDGADTSMFSANGGNGPTCTQCHGNPRDVNKAYFTGAFLQFKEPAGAYEYAFYEPEEGLGAPARRTFPHLSTNSYLLTGTGDAFCMNCHGTTNLP